MGALTDCLAPDVLDDLLGPELAAWRALIATPPPDPERAVMSPAAQRALQRPDRASQLAGAAQFGPAAAAM
jgi:hypothetical protein